ncbi:MAG TPA: type VI secretion system baseplate subunit TssG [Burkholderiaceae bacterium]|nr:type VI secretion system baseplate subunit TssG [Burkholderiaceae bacterium]
MLDEPHRFDLMQVVRLLEDLLAEHGVPRSAVLRDYIRFENSTALSFPASQIEALQADGEPTARTEVALRAALAHGKLSRIRITPAFIGLLGEHGVLPNHYTESIAAAQHARRDDGPRAFLDLFSNRMVALFCLAWRKHRLEQPQTDDGRDGMLPRLLALSGNLAGSGGAVPDEVAAYYAAAFRQRPVSAAMMQRVLADYFAIPVKVEPSVGHWHTLAPEHRTQLARQNNVLGAGVVLGPRLWRRDLRVGIRLGPLDRARYHHFCKDGPGAAALKAMLAMFDLPTLEFDIELVLQAAGMRSVTLSTRKPDNAARLGMDAFVYTRPPETDWGTTRYLITMA